MLRCRRAQSTMEYGLLIAVVVVALIAINFYMRRGIQGRVRESTDQIGRQFDPATYSTSWRIKSNGETTTNETRSGNQVTTTTASDSAETITRSEYETFGNNVPTPRY